MSLGKKPREHYTENQKPEKCILCVGHKISDMLGLNCRLFFFLNVIKKYMDNIYNNSLFTN